MMVMLTMSPYDDAMNDDVMNDVDVNDDDDLLMMMLLMLMLLSVVVHYVLTLPVLNHDPVYQLYHKRNHHELTDPPVFCLL